MNALQITLIVLLLTFMSQAVLAHTDHDKARFVAENGIDTGKCDNRFRPCKTLIYAARQANKGDKILVAEGQYLVTITFKRKNPLYTKRYFSTYLPFYQKHFTIEGSTLLLMVRPLHLLRH